MTKLTESKHGIEGYVSVAGFVILKQYDDVYGKDVTIAIHPEDVDTICQSLERYKKDALTLRAQPDFMIGRGAPEEE